MVERDVRQRVHYGVSALLDQRGFLSDIEIVDYVLDFVRRDLLDAATDHNETAATESNQAGWDAANKASALEEFAERI